MKKCAEKKYLACQFLAVRLFRYRHLIELKLEEIYSRRRAWITIEMTLFSDRKLDVDKFQRLWE